jgi:hypothetical protein
VGSLRKEENKEEKELKEVKAKREIKEERDKKDKREAGVVKESQKKMLNSGVRIPKVALFVNFMELSGGSPDRLPSQPPPYFASRTALPLLAFVPLSSSIRSRYIPHCDDFASNKS